MSILKSSLTRRELLLSGASAAALAAAGADLGAADLSASSQKPFTVAIKPSTGHRISRRIFGGDLDPIARVIYGGVWDRERNVPRADVKAAIGSLGTTAIRWPGSSSAAAYHWRDGVGPLNKRPVYETTFWTGYVHDLVDRLRISREEKANLMRQIDTGQPNQFGTNEFLQYCVDLDIDPVLSVNIGGGKSDGTPEEAAAWVRYCNVDRKTPRAVQWWQLGNEVWGTGDRDHQSPKDYANRVIKLATAMRSEDPKIKVICVATGVHPADFSEQWAIAFPQLDVWNREVFAIAGSHVNAASFTWYFPGSLERDLRSTEGDGLQMATAPDVFGAELDRLIDELDAEGAPHVPLYIGEWGRQVKIPENVLSENHRLYDGLFYAGCFNRMIERSPRMLGAHQCMLVNMMAPIQTVGDRLFVTAGYLVMQLYRWSCRAEHAPVSVQSDTLSVRAFEDVEKATFLVERARTARTAAILDATATVDRSGTTLYLINRSMTDPITVDLTGIEPASANARFRYVTADSPYVYNTLDAPNAVRVAEMAVAVQGGRARVTLPPCTAGALIAGSLTGALAAT
jgi:alpha-N-arabinofuranosidase